MHGVKERYTPYLLSRANVVGVGIGTKQRGGEPIGSRAISVLVEQKKPEQILDEHDVIPKTLDAVPTDVIEVGKLQAPPPPFPHRMQNKTQSMYQERMRPARPGVSIGHTSVTAGTFGCVVLQRDYPYILSNNHVLANSNQAKLGDSVLQPGRYDGGCDDDWIAELAAFEPISFSEIGATCAAVKFLEYVINKLALLLGSRHRFEARRLQNTLNVVDAAIARPRNAGLIDPAIVDNVGVPHRTEIAQLEMLVQKCGRTTGHTYGYISQIEATVQVSYGAGKLALFSDQIIVSTDEGSFSAGGDSGSSVLTRDGKVVGLLFAGSDRVTILNPIDYVLSLLDVELLTG